MQQVKEITLNGLLAVLVVLSIVLSYRVWFPSDQGALWQTKEAQVQSSPPPADLVATPKLHRPERIYVHKAEGMMALLPAGSDAYEDVLEGVDRVLTGLQPMTGLVPPEEEVDRNGDAITLVLPIPLMLDQWAQLWKWQAGGLTNFSLKVDRLTIYLAKTPMIYFSGATGPVYRVGPLAPVDQKLLQGLVAAVEPSRFQKYRPLVWKETTAKVAAGLVVPDVTDMPEGTLTLKRPDPVVEQARYFPDLSVVRHIEEKDAISYTDGQRWLRLTAGGQTEFATVAQGAPPDMKQSLGAADPWVLTHGGWLQDLVLTDWVQQPVRSSLVFNLRLDGGAYPVESAGPSDSTPGAMRLELTINRDQVVTVTQFRRYPEFTLQFGRRGRIPVMAPEKALQIAAAEHLSILMFEGEVREMHLAYLLWQRDKLSTWRLEPVWVINIGEKRIYVPAAPLTDMKSFIAGA
ncbi:MAG TPA: hypothetical protein VNT75_18670 [Symbiobacteriaceae bacterium]|nr:hypothetical protein [Symbiobacteriaceae bacterium]